MGGVDAIAIQHSAEFQFTVMGKFFDDFLLFCTLVVCGILLESICRFRETSK